MAHTSRDPDIEFLQHIGYVLIVTTIMSGAVTLSLTLSASTSVALADITSGQRAAIPSPLAVWQAPSE